MKEKITIATNVLIVVKFKAYSFSSKTIILHTVLVHILTMQTNNIISKNKTKKCCNKVNDNFEML